MINIAKKEIKMSSDLITKLKWACGSNYKVTNGYLRLLYKKSSINLNL